MQCTYGKLRLFMQEAFTGWCKHCSITPPQHHGSYRFSRNCPNPSSSCKGKHGPATWKGGQVRKRMSVGAAFPRDHESDTALAVLYHHQGKSDELVRPHCGWRGTCIAIKNSPKVDCTLSLAALQPCIHHLRTWLQRDGIERRHRPAGLKVNGKEETWENNFLCLQLMFYFE